jgi:hypothetical protein
LAVTTAAFSAEVAQLATLVLGTGVAAGVLAPALWLAGALAVAAPLAEPTVAVPHADTSAAAASRAAAIADCRTVAADGAITVPSERLWWLPVSHHSQPSLVAL